MADTSWRTCSGPSVRDVLLHTCRGLRAGPKSPEWGRVGLQGGSAPGAAGRQTSVRTTKLAATARGVRGGTARTQGLAGAGRPSWQRGCEGAKGAQDNQKEAFRVGVTWPLAGAQWVGPGQAGGQGPRTLRGAAAGPRLLPPPPHPQDSELLTFHLSWHHRSWAVSTAPAACLRSRRLAFRGPGLGAGHRPCGGPGQCPAHPGGRECRAEESCGFLSPRPPSLPDR